MTDVTPRFDETAHRLYCVPVSPRFELNFGSTYFFTSLTTGLPFEQLDSILKAGRGIYANYLIFPAIVFVAEAVVLLPQVPAAHARFFTDFEFGFVQATEFPGARLEYWGATAAYGMVTLDYIGSSGFEIDSDPGYLPWTRIAADRFSVKADPSVNPPDSHRLKITADCSDHPMLNFKHTVTAPLSGKKYFLRSIAFTRNFRTLFVVRHIPSNTFTPLGAVSWQVKYDHIVRYTGNGRRRIVTNRAGAPRFPPTGSRHFERLDTEILSMARARSPVVTHAELERRLKSNLRSNLVVPDRFPDPVFWKN